MRLKEIMKKRSAEDIETLSNLGAVNFGRSLTGEEEEVTPHYEIGKCLEMFEKNPIVNSGLNQLMLYLLPNKKIKISSKDEKTVKFLEQWHEQRKGIIEEYRNIWLTNKICGNGYQENHYGKTKNNEPVLDNIFSLNDASRIYVNPDSDGENAFIFELPVGIESFFYMGKWHQPAFHTVRYIKNYSYTRKRVYGIGIPAWKISHYKTGWSRDNLYGRSMLSSGIDAYNVMENIIKSWNTISMKRSVDKKLISIGETDGDIEIDQKRLDELGEQLEDDDKPFTLFNLPLKIMDTDISTSGKYDTLETVFDMLRRTLMLSLLPQHLTSWSDSSTTQGASEAMPSFVLRLKSEQNSFITFLNENVIGELRKTYKWLAKDATFVFDEPIVRSNETYINSIERMVMSGIISRSEAKTYLSELGIIDKDVMDEAQKRGTVGDGVTEENFKEELASTTFQTFKKKVDKKIKNEVAHNNVGGKDVRLVSTKDGFILYDGLNPISYFDSSTTKKAMKMVYDDYVRKLKKEQEEYEKDDSEEDIVINKTTDAVVDEIDKRLDKFFKMLDKSKVKKEGFLSSNIFKKLNGVFKGVNAQVKSITNSGYNDLMKMSISNDVKDNKKTQKLLNDKKQLMKNNISQEISDTTDDILRDIKRQLTDGLAAGQDFSTIKKNLKKKYGTEEGIDWKYKRTLNRELRNATSLVKLKKWDEMGFEKVVWHTKEDEKVRASHAKRNKRVYEIKDMLNGNEIYPGKEINCRCRLSLYQ